MGAREDMNAKLQAGYLGNFPIRVRNIDFAGRLVTPCGLGPACPVGSHSTGGHPRRRQTHPKESFERIREDSGWSGQDRSCRENPRRGRSHHLPCLPALRCSHA